MLIDECHCGAHCTDWERIERERERRRERERKGERVEGRESGRERVDPCNNKTNHQLV